jgi:Pyridoxamine 5'-phosphate oxidase
MASWSQFEAEAPELAAQVRAAFAAGRHCTLATLRSDGAPRISGTEVEFDGGEVYLGMMPGSMKARDVLRDPRLAVHSPTRDPVTPSDWAGEAKFSGVGRQVEPPQGYPAGGLRFLVELTSVVLTDLTNTADALRIRLWRPGRPTETMTRA